MKTDKTRSSFYTTILATLLRKWREQNHITVYSVAKAINASPHTITRFEHLKGGISLEVGLRYLEYADTHISHPNIFEKYHVAIVQHKTEEEQQIYLTEQKHKAQLLIDEKQMLTDRIAKLEQENTILRNENRAASFESSSKSKWISKLKKVF